MAERQWRAKAIVTHDTFLWAQILFLTHEKHNRCWKNGNTVWVGKHSNGISYKDGLYLTGKTNHWQTLTSSKTWTFVYTLYAYFWLTQYNYNMMSCCIEGGHYLLLSFHLVKKGVTLYCEWRLVRSFSVTANRYLSHKIAHHITKNGASLKHTY